MNIDFRFLDNFGGENNTFSVTSTWADIICFGAKTFMKIIFSPSLPYMVSMRKFWK